MNENLILGIGNLVLADDAIGPLMARELYKNYKHERFDYLENYSCGIDLLYDINGYKRLAIIDSITIENEKPGQCLTFELNDLDEHLYENFLSSHGLNLPTLWKLGKKLDFDMPEECLIFGITIEKCWHFSEELTDQIKLNFNNIALSIYNKTLQWAND